MADKKFYNNVQIKGKIKLPNESQQKAVIIDASGQVTSSTVTSTELGHLSGVTSSVQSQLDAKIPATEKGSANGVATLDAGGKIPASQLPNSVMELQGSYDASTNSPSLTDGTGNPGDVYKVTVAGTRDFGNGPITFAVNDLVMYGADGKYFKSTAPDSVISVNGAQGIVVLDTDDISEGSTNLYHTDLRASTATSAVLTNTSSISFTGSTGSDIHASVLPAGVDHDSLQNYSANKHVDHSVVSISTATDSGLTGGGNITTTRSLSVDITGTTSVSVAENTDELLIYDVSASALRKITKQNFIENIGSPGDISETSYTLLNDQSTATDITGLAFDIGVVRSADVLLSVEIDATSDIYETFKCLVVNKGTSFDMSVESVGDDSGVILSIDNTGQIKYTSANISGFSTGAIKFRAITTSV